MGGSVLRVDAFGQHAERVTAWVIPYCVAEESPVDALFAPIPSVVACLFSTRRYWYFILS